jgi:hypothetical protein
MDICDSKSTIFINSNKDDNTLILIHYFKRITISARLTAVPSGGFGIEVKTISSDFISSKCLVISKKNGGGLTYLYQNSNAENQRQFHAISRLQ